MIIYIYNCTGGGQYRQVMHTKLKKKLLNENPNQNTKVNIPNAERNALNNLQTDMSIIIKEADKGVAIVDMDKQHYKTKNRRTA